jgi:pimeloyl-ACP methyl ester carboxylesterase
MVGVPSCAAVTDDRPAARLAPCASDEGPIDAYCGTLTVFEDRAAASGRQIDLWVVVLPSLSATPLEDPVFFLAGGPGQGAAQLAGHIAPLFRRIQRTRDIVLVDQRGTGKSSPLECRSHSSSLREFSEDAEAALTRLQDCLDGYDADVRLYTTDIAMDDLDDVRAYLGYDRVNLYGGSYGTRAALVYLRQHPDRVRSVVLDGVAPTDMRLPLFTARDAQRALDTLLTDCDGSLSCRAAFPGLPSRVRALITRLEQEPPLVRISHPRTHVTEEVRVTARVVASVLFSALYSPLTASIVPTLIERAEQDDFTGLFALALAGDGGDNMSLGMQLSVLCSEDSSRVTTDDVRRESARTMFGAHLLGGQLDACAMWPKRTMEAAYYAPVVSDVPALVLSGDIDPVTPPGWGDLAVQSLGNGRHIALPATGHGVISTSCGMRLVRQFIDAGSAATLDTDCVTRIRRPPFFVTPAGPAVGPTHSALAR